MKSLGEKIDYFPNDSKRIWDFFLKHTKYIWIFLDGKFKIRYINEEALKKTLFLEKNDLIGQFLENYVHSEDYNRMVKMFKGEQKKKEEFIKGRLKHRDGYYIWVKINGEIYHDGETQKILLVCQNINENKQITQKLRMTRKNSETTFQNNYKRSSFFNKLFAHDVQNILSIIKGSAELCSAYLADPESKNEISQHLEVIKEQVHRATKLVLNMMRLSNLERDEPIIKRIDAYSLLKDCVEYIKHSFPERKIKVTFKSFTNNYDIKANELLRDVFENLLNNVVIHNEHLIIKVLIRLSDLYKHGQNYLKIEFIDNGIGISDGMKKNLFEPKKFEGMEGKGMGIGLTIVKMIIESYKGKIWVENAVPGDHSKGSNFVLLIPSFR